MRTVNLMASRWLAFLLLLCSPPETAHPLEGVAAMGEVKPMRSSVAASETEMLAGGFEPVDSLTITLSGVSFHVVKLRTTAQESWFDQLEALLVFHEDEEIGRVTDFLLVDTFAEFAEDVRYSVDSAGHPRAALLDVSYGGGGSSWLLNWSDCLLLTPCGVRSAQAVIRNHGYEGNILGVSLPKSPGQPYMMLISDYGYLKSEWVQDCFGFSNAEMPTFPRVLQLSGDTLEDVSSSLDKNVRDQLLTRVISYGTEWTWNHEFAGDLFGPATAGGPSASRAFESAGTDPRSLSSLLTILATYYVLGLKTEGRAAILSLASQANLSFPIEVWGSSDAPGTVASMTSLLELMETAAKEATASPSLGQV